MSDTNVHRVVGNLLVGSSHFFVDTTNNKVGINTSSPSASLDIATGDLKVGSGITLGNSGTITAANFSGNGSGLNGINSDSGSWVNGASSNIHLAVSTDKVGIGTVSPQTLLHVAGNGQTSTGGIIRAQLDDPGGAPYESNAFTMRMGGYSHSIRMDLNTLRLNAYGDAGRYGAMQFVVGDGTGSGNGQVTAMTIGTGGQVGIGTSSPQQNLHVHESGSGQVVIAVTNDTTGGGNNDGIHFGIDASEQGFVWHKQNTALLFATNNAERMRLANDGKLGIGTTTPHGALDVRGAVTITTPTRDSVSTKTGYMAAGSLNIGSVAANFGGGSGWNGNTAGFMLECQDNTEIAVHDSGHRVSSLMYYQGGSIDMITIGRDMGWGTTRTEFGESGKRNLFYAPNNWSWSTASTGGTILWSFTYNFPYDGYCIFNTNGHFNNSAANQWVYAKVVINGAGTANTSGYYDSYTQGGAGSHGGDFHAYKDSSVSWQDFNWGGTLKVSAGNRTIGLHVKVSAGTVSINGAAINMFYIPTKIF